MMKLLRWLTGVIPVVAFAAYFLAVLPPKPVKAQMSAVQTWLGTVGGTANAISVPVHNVATLNDLLGVPLRFLAASANAGPTTFTIQLDGGGTLGPTSILKPSAGGGSLISLVGNELQASQIVDIVYDGAQFECSRCMTTVASGTIVDYAGATAPAGWLKTDGSAISRSANPALLNAIALINQSATTTNLNTSVVVANSALYQIGWFVGGTNVSCNSTITAIPDGTHITLSANATASGSTSLSIGPWQQGDCINTFNLPNLVGRTTAMVDGSTNITSATCTNAGSLGTACGAQTTILATPNLPPYTPSGNVTTTIGGGAHYYTFPGSNVGVGGTSSGGQDNLFTSNQPVSSFSGTAQGGTSTPFARIMPIAMVYKIIKL